MPPIRLNRRHFLGYSAAAGLALSQPGAEGSGSAAAGEPVRLGLVGLGNRGTSLLRILLERPEARVVAVADTEPRHRVRAQGIAEKATGARPLGLERLEQVLDREDVEAVVVALPCDLHAGAYLAAIGAGKHLYGEKPLGLTLGECDAVIAAAAARPRLAVHAGFQRRSNPRYQRAVELVKQGELGDLVAFRGHWISSNGPVSGHEGWLASRARSGDWMVEQAIHVWDVLNWVAGGPPSHAYGSGRRDVFSGSPPGRDVTDHYHVMLKWEQGGFGGSFTHSWIDPADDSYTGHSLQLVGTAGAIDLAAGVATFRDRTRARLPLSPGAVNDTAMGLAAFLGAIRSPEPVAAPIVLEEARDALRTALLVRRAVSLGRDEVVRMDEVEGDNGWA